jgi:hypothetical protein
MSAMGQLRRSEAIIDESGLPSIAAETRRSDLAAGDIVVE